MANHGFTDMVLSREMAFITQIYIHTYVDYIILLNLPDGMRIICLRTIGSNHRSVLDGIPTKGVESQGGVWVSEHLYLGEARSLLLAQRPEHGELHGYIAVVGSQLQRCLPVCVHKRLSCGSIHQCKCPVALVVG
jgi:hypothetical protein